MRAAALFASAWLALLGCVLPGAGTPPTPLDPLVARVAATAQAVAGVGDGSRRASTTPNGRATEDSRLATPIPVADGASPTPLIAFPPSKPLVYVAIGASDAVGVGALDPARDGYVAAIGRRLPSGSRPVSLGAAGARIADALARQMPRAIDEKPDLVTVWMVVNDLNAATNLVAYERDLDRLLRDLTAKTTARVIVVNSPDLSEIPAYAALGIPAEAIRPEVLKWNVVIARTVARYPGRAYLVDVYARSSEIEYDSGLVAADDFHPSSRGYNRLAEIVWEFMVANRVVAAG
ncbi:MAG: hypothetical protein EPO26_02125 [Chloroflexota bacterium]|nr:MAG: hypothetical protein EPO26_02125 [Chloroflexota bacterium]